MNVILVHGPAVYPGLNLTSIRHLRMEDFDSSFGQNNKEDRNGRILIEFLGHESMMDGKGKFQYIDKHETHRLPH